MILYQYLKTVEQIEQACAKILQATPPRLGLDIESSSNTQFPEVITLALPYAIEEVSNYQTLETSVQQTQIVVYLLQIKDKYSGLSNLQELLQSQYIIKIGCDLSGDGHALNAALGCTLNSTLDLQTLEMSLGSRAYSLNLLAQKYLNLQKISFSHRNADWSGELSLRQLKYAIFDAYLTLGVYEAMLHINTTETQAAPAAEFEQSLLDFLAYSTVFAGKRPPSRAKVLKAIVNNYAPWRKMHPSKSKPLAEAELAQLIQQGVLEVTGNNCLVWRQVNYTLPTQETETQLKELYAHMQKVHQSPMKYTSLVRALTNKFWVNTPVYARERRTQNAIQEMANKAWLKYDNNYVSW